jgi:glycosyltransferase involved in cell wall biosynthesis
MTQILIERLKDAVYRRIKMWSWSDSYLRLRLTSSVKMPVKEERTVSIAIPFYNNARMAHVSLFNILGDPRVAEIIVLDDGSSQNEFKKLAKKIKPFSRKVKLFRRNTNWGALANKIQAVELCSSAWVILLDYDNTLPPEYLDSIFNIKDWDRSTIYCPGYACPKFDFREELGGQIITLDLASKMANSKSLNESFFNIGNYFLPRQRFLDCVKPFWQRSVAASDVIFANYLWLSSENTLTVLRDLKYIHRVHGKSSWITSSEKSLQVNDFLIQKICDKVDPYSERLREDIQELPKEWVQPELF